MEQNLKRLLKNYSNARRSWEVWCYMLNIEVETVRFDIARYIKNDNFLSHFLYLSMKDFYIEMYKIIKESKHNEDNVFHLLNTLIKTNPEKSEQAKLNLNELKKIEPIIKTMCDIRDKYYAHLDKDYENYIYRGFKIGDDKKCFYAIEQALITLSSKEMLQSYLDAIPSRNEFRLEIVNI